jgi:hypothetical protein
MNLEATLTVVKKNQCVIKKWFDKLPLDDQNQINQALETHALHLVWRALVNEGFDIAPTSFYRHFTRTCSCS